MYIQDVEKLETLKYICKHVLKVWFKENYTKEKIKKNKTENMKIKENFKR